MASVKDVLAFILKSYSEPDECSSARVTKIVYLSDWHHTIKNGEPITDIEWYFNNYGPFVMGVKEAAETNPELFSIKESTTSTGGRRSFLHLRKGTYEPQLSATEKASISHVISRTEGMSWPEFLRLVYSTHPVLTSERYTFLDLKAKAKEYEKSLRSLEDHFQGGD